MKNKETIYTLITVLGVVTIVTTLGFATNGFTHLTNAEKFLLRLKSNCINNYKVVDGGFFLYTTETGL